MDCQLNEEEVHTFTGVETTFQEEGMAAGGEHEVCFTTSVMSASNAIMELLTSSDQPWICMKCMHLPGHKAMSSQADKACNTCSLALRSTVEYFTLTWLTSLMQKAGFITTESGSQEINYSRVAEFLVYPHGEKNGLIKPGMQTPGSEATCTCEKQNKAPVISAAEAETVSSVDGASASGEEHMDTSILEEPKVGRDPVVTHFQGSCKMPAMLALVPDSYCKELLSTRLQGDEIKEALAITIYRQYKQENPCLNPPAWFPAEILRKSEQELTDRMAFLTIKSMTQTYKEKKGGQELTVHPGVATSAQGKRKLQLSTSDDLDPRPVKRAKMFTTTPAEMVRLCAQFSQATAAALDKRLNPLKTMETLVEKIERSRKKQQSIQQGTEGAPPGNPSDQAPEVGAVEAPLVPSASGAAAATNDSSVAAPRLSPPPPVEASTRGGGGTSIGRGRGRGGQGANNQRVGVQQEGVIAGGPVRCSHLTAPNIYCSVPNFPEALRCRGCGRGLQNDRAPSIAPQQQRGGGRGFRGRGGRGSRPRRWGGRF
jgi:hypothetical protein